MARLAIVNMLLGFILVSFAAAAGSFIANDITLAYLRDQAALSSWQLNLERSAHGHTTLFGLVHIALGLTMPYARLRAKIQLLQTIGLSAGSLTMAGLMLVRAAMGPPPGADFLGVLIGIGLSGALLALVAQALGLGLRLLER